MEDLVIRFIVGGAVVSIFAIVGDSFNKSFGGLFGAAPSVAVASLALTVAREGRLYSAVEARSNACGFGGTALVCCSSSLPDGAPTNTRLDIYVDRSPRMVCCNIRLLVGVSEIAVCW